MALAAVLKNVLERGGIGPPPTPYSWLSKGVATGVNKHTVWILGMIAWRIFK